MISVSKYSRQHTEIIIATWIFASSAVIFPLSMKATVLISLAKIRPTREIALRTVRTIRIMLLILRFFASSFIIKYLSVNGFVLILFPEN